MSSEHDQILVFSIAWKGQSLACGRNGSGCQDEGRLLPREQERGTTRSGVSVNPVEGVSVLPTTQNTLRQMQLSLSRGHSNLLKGHYPLKNAFLLHSYFHPLAKL